MSAALERIRQFWPSAGIWRLPALMGIAATTIVWCVWYFTKIPCLPDNAVKGLCNPGWLARFINAEILVLAGGAGIAVATLKGGYDYYMLKNMINQEREARLKTERELQEVRELIAELRNELHEERQRAAEERRQDMEERQRAAEERRQDMEERQRAAAERRQAETERRQAETERRQAETERRQAETEERRQSIALQQAMLEAIVQLAQGRNGNGSRASD